MTYIRDGDRVLLIRKKRGVGEGLLNGPGGKLEPGETPRAAAVREVQEEVGVTPRGVEKRGEIHFVFGEDPFMHTHVFHADGFDGEPRESAEAAPVWHDVAAVPYEEMWPDDQYWMPLFFDDKVFHATFHFDADGDKIRQYELETGTHQHPHTAGKQDS